MSNYNQYSNYPYQYPVGYNGLYQNPNNNNLQAQVQINKKKIALIQDQNASNMIMCRILSELENLAIHFSYPGKVYFGYYATIPSNYQDIIDQIIIQMEIFESSYKNFRKANPNKQYIFPTNLQYTNVIAIINSWKTYLEKKGKETKNKKYLDVLKYYDEFLNILSNSNLSRSFKKEFDNLGKNAPPIDENELKRIMNAGATANCFINEKFSEIEEEVIKKGDYKVNVVLMGDRKDNKYYNNMDKYDEKLNNYKKELYNCLNLMLAYLEKYAMLGEGPSKKIAPKYSKIIQINSNNKDKIFDEYMNYSNKFYEIYFSNELDYKLSAQEINIIENDINSWKSIITDFPIKKELDKAIKNIKNQENDDEK